MLAENQKGQFLRDRYLVADNVIAQKNLKKLEGIFSRRSDEGPGLSFAVPLSQAKTIDLSAEMFEPGSYTVPSSISFFGQQAAGVR